MADRKNISGPSAPGVAPTIESPVASAPNSATAPTGVIDPGQLEDSFIASAPALDPIPLFREPGVLPAFLEKMHSLPNGTIAETSPQGPNPKRTGDVICGEWMDAIQGLTALLESEKPELNYHPFQAHSLFYRHLEDPRLLECLTRLVYALTITMRLCPSWPEASSLARNLSEILGALPVGQIDEKLMALFNESRPAQYASRYHPLIETGWDIHPDGGQVKINPEKLGNQAYRSALAIAMFRESRGAPRVAHAIITDLAFLLSQPKYRTLAIQLLREFIPLGATYPTNDAIVIRDYSTRPGEDEPFYLMTAPGVAVPDNWTHFTRQGLKSVGLAGRSFIEVGTGTGALGIDAVKHLGAGPGFSIDINPATRTLATINAWLQSTDADGNRLAGPQPIDQIQFSDTGDLLRGFPQGQTVDVIFASLAQLVAKRQLTMEEKAELYVSQGYPENIDGFELLARLLEQAPEYLSDNGVVLLNISGRPGLRAIHHMALRRGYVPEVVLEDLLSQDRSSYLSEFVRIEHRGLREPFEFFLDGQVLTATELAYWLKFYHAKLKQARTETEIEALKQDTEYCVTHRQYLMRFTPLAKDYPAWQTEALARQSAHLTEQGYLGTLSASELAETTATYLSYLFEHQVPASALHFGPNQSALLAHYLLTCPHGPRGFYLDPKIAHLVPPALLSKITVAPDLDVSSAVILPLAWMGTTSDRLQTLMAKKQDQLSVLFVASAHDVNSLAVLARYMLKNQKLNSISILWDFADRLPGAPLPALITWEPSFGYSLALPSLQLIAQGVTMEALLKTVDLDGLHFPALGTVDLQTDTVKGIDLSRHESEFSSIKLPALSGSETTEVPIQQVAAYLEQTQRAVDGPDQVILPGAGIQALLSATLHYLSVRHGMTPGVMVPSAHSLTGPFAKFRKILFDLDTTKDAGTIFADLMEWEEDRPYAQPAHCVWLAHPVPAEALKALARFCRKNELLLLVRESPLTTDQNIGTLRELRADPQLGEWARKNALGFDSLADSLALSTLNFGVAYGPANLLAGIKPWLWTPLHPQSSAWMKALLEPNIYHPLLSAHRDWLASQKAKLLAVLMPHVAKGLIVLNDVADAFSLAVDVSALFHRTIELNGHQLLIAEDGANLPDILSKELGLKVASGNPLRLCFALARLDSALEKLAVFFESAAQGIGPRDLCVVEAIREKLGKMPAGRLGSFKFLPVTAGEKLPTLSGPTILYLDRGQAKTRVISTLHHGTHSSGLNALTQFLATAPLVDPSNLAIIIHNPQNMPADWVDDEAHLGQIRLVLASLGPIEALLLLGNVEVASEPFSFLTKAQDALARLLGHKTVVAIDSQHKLMALLDGFGPAILLITGESGSESAHLVATQALDAIINAPPDFMEQRYEPVPCFKQMAMLQLTDPQPGVLALREGLSSLNFQSSKEPVWMAHWLPQQGEELPWSLVATSPVGNFDDLFIYENGKIYLRPGFSLFMSSATNRLYIGKRDYPQAIQYIDHLHLAGNIYSANKQVVLADPRVKFAGKFGELDITAKIKLGKKSVGNVRLSYRHDELNPDFFVVSDTFITMNLTGLKYGFELRSDLIRYNHDLPRVHRIDLDTKNSLGSYAWRHFDGFQLSPPALARIRKTLRSWNGKYKLGLSVKFVEQASSPLDFVHLTTDRAAVQGLMTTARLAYAHKNLSDGDLLEKTHHVGELALLSLKEDGEVVSYTMSLNLRRGNPDYLLFLDSLIRFWENQPHLHLPRARAILEDLSKEKELLLMDPEIREAYEDALEEKTALHRRRPASGVRSRPRSPGGSFRATHGTHPTVNLKKTFSTRSPVETATQTLEPQTLIMAPQLSNPARVNPLSNPKPLIQQSTRTPHLQAMRTIPHSHRSYAARIHSFIKP